VALYFSAAHNLDRGDRRVLQVEDFAFLTMPVRFVQRLERVDGAIAFAGGHADAERQRREAAALGIDENRRYCRLRRVDALGAQYLSA